MLSITLPFRIWPSTHLKCINESFFMIKVEEGGKIHEKMQGGYSGGLSVMAVGLEPQGHSRGQLHHTAALAPASALRLVNYLTQQLVQQRHYFLVVLLGKEIRHQNTRRYICNLKKR